MNTPQKSITTNDDAETAWRDHDQDQERPSDLLAGVAAIESAPGSVRDKTIAFLNVVTEHFGCLSSSITVGIGGDEIELVLNGDVDGVDKWKSNLQATALEARSQASSIARLFGPESTAEYAVVACPIDNSGRDPFGAVAVLIRCSSTSHAERVQLHLRTACLQIASVLTKKAPSRGVVEMSDIARIYTRASQFKSIQQFAYTITNSARQRFNCEQAAMGLVRNDKIRVACISGLDAVKLRSPGVLKIEQAMGECVDAGAPMVSQPRDRWEDSDVVEEGLLHQVWRASVSGGASVLSVPIDTGDGAVAVMSFRRSGEEPFDADDIEAATKLLVPLAGAIPLVTRATQTLPVHTSKTARAAVLWCAGPNTIRRKIVILIALFAIAWAALGTRMYRVSVPALIVAKNEQVVAAPFGGRVETVLVRNGDRVESGQPLFELDTKALELEYRDLQAELSNAQLRLTGEMAGSNPAAASIAQGDIRSITTRIKRVLTKLEDATVRAPHAGIVMGSELANLPGRVISTGEAIASIAEDGSMSLELQVPQNRVSDLVEGSRLRFASHARPEIPGYSSLGNLAPSSVERNGQSIFLADADLPEDQTWLRPGMSGVAFIEVGERSNWWLAIHRVVDSARLRFWFD